MSISAYCGLPGAGKSHGLVLFVVLRALGQGRRVVHNLPLNEESIRAIVTTGELVKIPDGQGADDFIKWFRSDHAGALLILDEAWRYLGAGIKASSIPEHQREFFAMHRHLVGQTDDGRTTDIYLCCQNLGQIARFIVDLVEETFIYTKATNLGLSKRYRCDTYAGGITGAKGPVSRRLSYFLGKYDPKVFACYQSHTLNKGVASGIEKKVDDRGTIFKSFQFRAAVVGLLLIGPAIWLSVHQFRKLAGPKVQPASGAKPSATGGPTANAIVKPVESTRWRLGGTVQIGDFAYIVIESQSGSRRLPMESCILNAQRQRICVLDGEIVASWTGEAPRDFVGSFLTAATVPTAATR